MWWKGKLNVPFSLNTNVSTLRWPVWFPFSYLCYGYKYDYAKDGMQYMDLSGATIGWCLRAWFSWVRLIQKVRPGKQGLRGFGDSWTPISDPSSHHQPTTSPIMSLCMCECMWLARMNLQCVSVYPGARVFMRLNKLSYLPPIRALMSTRNVPFGILRMCYKLRAQGRVIC